MSAGSVEERIIQYMDGELGDTERAELLHRASVSPEIRQLFTEHEQLQQISQRAVLASSISPALEERVLTHVSQLAAAERRRTGYFWWNSWFRLSAALLLFGVLGYTIYELTSSSDHVVATSSSIASQSSSIDKPDNTTPSDVPSNGGLALSSLKKQEANISQATRSVNPTAGISRDVHVTNRVYAVQQHGPRSAEFQANADLLPVPNSSDQNISAQPSATEQANVLSAVANEASIASVTMVAPHTAIAASAGSSYHSTNFLTHIRPIGIDRPAGISDFELGLQTSSGFSYPASGPTVHPFADFRANLTYFLGEHDVVGLRVTSGIFQTLPSIVKSTTSSAIVVHRDLSEQRELAEEVFYGHRFLLSPQSGLALEIAGGAGLIPQGNTFSFELGFKLPFGEHLTGTAGFSLMRIHSTAPLMRDVISSELSSAGEMPIIFQGSDIRNTLNGRIQYGLAYRF